MGKYIISKVEVKREIIVLLKSRDFIIADEEDQRNTPKTIADVMDRSFIITKNGFYSLTPNTVR